MVFQTFMFLSILFPVCRNTAQYLPLVEQSWPLGVQTPAGSARRAPCRTHGRALWRRNSAGGSRPSVRFGICSHIASPLARRHGSVWLVPPSSDRCRPRAMRGVRRSRPAPATDSVSALPPLPNVASAGGPAFAASVLRGRVSLFFFFCSFLFAEWIRSAIIGV